MQLLSVNPVKFFLSTIAISFTGALMVMFILERSGKGFLLVDVTGPAGGSFQGLGAWLILAAALFVPYMIVGTGLLYLLRRRENQTRNVATVTAFLIYAAIVILFLTQ